MTWIENNSEGISTFRSTATTTQEVQQDLLIVLQKLVADHLDDAHHAILIYSDATNGFVYCSAFDTIAGEGNDDRGCSLELPVLWTALVEDGGSADELDEVVLEAVELAFDTELGMVLPGNLKIYFQNEVNDPVPVSADPDDHDQGPASQG